MPEQIHIGLLLAAVCALFAMNVITVLWLARVSDQVTKFGRLLLKVRRFLKIRHKWTG